jgi:hypothetical protein
MRYSTSRHHELQSHQRTGILEHLVLGWRLHPGDLHDLIASLGPNRQLVALYNCGIGCTMTAKVDGVLPRAV